MSVRDNENKNGIFVKGAREHNLRNIDVFIPRNKITVITGLSGSGKSTLAFDTIYAEGQRRYIESLSVYARNFLEQLKKPEVDSITGLSPAIAIEQKTTSTNPRSTVGTVTEIYDYLRLLYVKAGTPTCPDHHIPLTGQDVEHIIADVLAMTKNTKIHVLSPVARAKKGEFFAEFQKWLKSGYIRARVDGKYVELESAGKLVKTKTHDIELLIDRLVIKPDIHARLKESIEAAFSLSGGYLIIENIESGEQRVYSKNLACPKCDFNFPEIEPRLLSFNNPKGACPACNGLGSLDFQDEVTLETSQSDDEEEREVDELALRACPDCDGYRLKKEALAILIEGQHIGQLSELPIKKLTEYIRNKKWNPREQQILSKLLKQLQSRLDILSELGVGYLSLSRATRTLSGGESQRIRLATQLGSALVGVLYVLDEPSIGLHARDQNNLLTALSFLRDRGNTIILVEHDEETIRVADKVIDLGPRAGILGGIIQAEGTLKEICDNPKSLTGQYLSGKKKASISRARTDKPDRWISLSGASGNNLKSVDLRLPLGRLTSVTGVSGSGKSTLILDTLFRILSNKFNKSSLRLPQFKKIEGIENLDSVVDINQKPIGRTPRSNPATYVGLFSMIRDLYAHLPESRLRGYAPGRFSFNVKGGRCEACQGAGQIRMEMHFLAEVFVQCDVCGGKRYNRETLNVKFKDKSIADVLSMSVAEAAPFFENHKRIYTKLHTLNQVGLDYITLGQSSITLSGGEAQRVKLSKELSKRSTGKTLYILDEPTTGLHFEDVHKLLELLHTLVDQGNTVVVIEHNLDIIRSSDYIVDLGPEGGEGGGQIVASGTLSEIKKSKVSLTARFL